MQDLDTLWRRIFPEGEVPSLTGDERWKEIGFQGKSPSTDFRGGGILSLYCMMYFVL